MLPTNNPPRRSARGRVQPQPPYNGYKCRYCKLIFSDKHYYNQHINNSVVCHAEHARQRPETYPAGLQLPPAPEQDAFDAVVSSQLNAEAPNLTHTPPVASIDVPTQADDSPSIANDSYEFSNHAPRFCDVLSPDTQPGLDSPHSFDFHQEDDTTQPPPQHYPQTTHMPFKDYVFDPYFVEAEYTDEPSAALYNFDDRNLPPLPKLPTGPPHLPTLHQGAKVPPLTQSLDADCLFDQKAMDKVSSVFEKQMLKLIIKLDKFGAPLYAFQEITDWIEESIQLKLLHRGDQGQDLRSMKRDTFIKHLQDQFPDIKAPSSTHVALEDTITTPFLSGLSVLDPGFVPKSTDELAEDFRRLPRSTSQVPHFDAKDQIISLLKDNDLFGDPSNLYVNETKNPDDLFTPYRPNAQQPIDGPMAGSWYQQTTRSKFFDQDREFVIPLVGYIDATGTDAFSRFRLEPFLISFALFRPKTFARANAWRMLGLIPDIDLESTAKKKKKRSNPNGGKSMNCRNYHRQLRVVLDSLIKLQDTGLMYNLQIGSHKKLVRLTFPMAFIMGDQKSNNLLSGRYSSHSETVNRCSRACFVSYSELANTEQKCFKVPSELFVQLNQHLFNEAKKMEDFMASTIQSTGATQRETLHADERSLSDSSGALPEESSDNGRDEDASATDNASASVTSDDVSVACDESSRSSTNDDSTSGSSSRVLGMRSNKDERSPNLQHDKEDQAFITAYINLNEERNNLLAQKMPYQASEEDKTSRKEDLAESRRRIYCLCREKVQSILGTEDLNSLSTRQWHSKRLRLWAWVNSLSPDQTRGVMAVFAQYESHLATHEIWFGRDRYGINLCTPTDLMHAFLLGVVRYAMESMFKRWPPRFCAKIDDLVDQTIRTQNQNERRNFPRADFSKGITNLTQLTAQEWGGLAFTVYLVLISGEGSAAYRENVSHKGTTTLSQAAVASNLKKDIDCLAQILSFMSYYKYGTYWRPNNIEAQEECLKSIQVLSRSLQDQLPRDDGLGWSVSKLHEITHTPLDIERYGSPSGFDASTGERLLKFVAKIPSKNVQKQSYGKFMLQLLSRLHEATLLQRALTAWLPDEQESGINSATATTEHQQCQKLLSHRGIGTQNNNTLVCTVRSFVAELNIGLLTTEASGGVGNLSRPDAHYAVNKCFSTEAGSKNMIPRIHPLVLTEIYRKVACLVCDAYHEGTGRTSDWQVDQSEVLDGTYICKVVVTVNGYSEGYINRPSDCGATPHGNDNLFRERCFRVRCIPSYRRERPWYDWIECMPNIIPDCDSGHEVLGPVCQILSMFSYTATPPVGSTLTNLGKHKILAVVWGLSSGSQQDEVLVDRMLRRHTLVENEIGVSRPLLQVVDINQIARRRVMVVEDYPGLFERYNSPLRDAEVMHYVSVVHPMKQCWSQRFTSDSTTSPDALIVESTRLRQESLINSSAAAGLCVCASAAVAECVPLSSIIPSTNQQSYDATALTRGASSNGGLVNARTTTLRRRAVATNGGELSRDKSRAGPPPVLVRPRTNGRTYGSPRGTRSRAKKKRKV